MGLGERHGRRSCGGEWRLRWWWWCGDRLMMIAGLDRDDNGAGLRWRLLRDRLRRRWRYRSCFGGCGGGGEAESSRARLGALGLGPTPWQGSPPLLVLHPLSPWMCLSFFVFFFYCVFVLFFTLGMGGFFFFFGGCNMRL